MGAADLDKALSLMIKTCGRGRSYVGGMLVLSLAGYSDEDRQKALKLWRLWKAGEKAEGGKHERG